MLALVTILLQSEKKCQRKEENNEGNGKETKNEMNTVEEFPGS